MKLTKEILLANRTPNGAWTRAQLEAIGVQWPPKRGWHREVIGKVISDAEFKQFSIANKNGAVRPGISNLVQHQALGNSSPGVKPGETPHSNIVDSPSKKI